MAENKMRVGIKYCVTKGNSDGSIFVGDIIMLDKDGDIVCDKVGWFEKDHLTPDVMDFEVEEADKNKMPQIAAMFGKKIGEEFNIYSEYRGTLKCKITDNGLSFYYDAYGRWWEDSGLLIELLKGDVVIVDE